MAKMFSLMHQSVNDFSKQMLAEMRRHNYVTPTNYLELVDGFKQLRSLFTRVVYLGPQYFSIFCVISVT